MKNIQSIDSVIFAGGGSRCVWQVGFLSAVSKSMGIKPRTVGAVSAGAAMACIYFAGVFERSFEYFRE